MLAVVLVLAVLVLVLARLLVLLTSLAAGHPLCCGRCHQPRQALPRRRRRRGGGL